MSIIVDEKSKIVVQGITGKEGAFHTNQMMEYGTKVVAGVLSGSSGAGSCSKPCRKMPLTVL